MTILSVAYPFAPVGPDAVGGAEQVLAQLDCGLVDAGHRSLVLAREDSRVRGTLLGVPACREPIDEAAREKAAGLHREAMTRALRDHPVDLVHLHGLDFLSYLPAPGPPVLATLHLPPSWYPEEVFRLSRPRTWLNPVSAAQARDCPPCPGLLPPIANGVPVERLAARHAKRDFAVFLGRICPEKGVHLALDAAHAADVSLIVAGEVFAYDAHRRYFEEAVKPRLDRRRRFVGPVGFDRKRRLLTAARCLLVPSLVAETSSLVAREALACGTPVVAFPNGALADLVEPGLTGFLAYDTEGLAAGIDACRTIDPVVCRQVARERFSLASTVAAYLDLYSRLIAGPARDMKSWA